VVGGLELEEVVRAYKLLVGFNVEGVNKKAKETEGVWKAKTKVKAWGRGLKRIFVWSVYPRLIHDSYYSPPAHLNAVLSATPRFPQLFRTLY